MGLDLWQAHPGALIEPHARAHCVPEPLLASAHKLQALKQIPQWKREGVELRNYKTEYILDKRRKRADKKNSLDEELANCDLARCPFL